MIFRARGSIPTLLKSSSPHGLVPFGDQHSVDAADANGRTVAERNAAWPEGLPAIARQALDFDHGIDRRARGRRGLAAEAQRKPDTLTGVKAQANRYRIPDWADSRIRDLALDQVA